jgi:hypothetical protein
MITTQITDGDGSGNRLKINGEGEVGVVVHSHPPIAESFAAIPFRQFFTNTSDSSDMQVVGTLAAPIVFSIDASPTHDIYIKTISVEIADASATLNKFGNITALTNGVEFTWQTADLGTTVIADALKTNWDFVRLALGNPGFGDAAGSFRASNVSGTSEGYIPVVDLHQLFGLQWGVRLRAGTTDKLFFSVKDDTTGVDSFNIIAYGVTVKDSH